MEVNVGYSILKTECKMRSIEEILRGIEKKHTNILKNFTQKPDIYWFFKQILKKYFSNYYFKIYKISKITEFTFFLLLFLLQNLCVSLESHNLNEKIFLSTMDVDLDRSSSCETTCDILMKAATNESSFTDDWDTTKHSGNGSFGSLNYQDNLQSYMDVGSDSSSSFDILMKVAAYESSLSDEFDATGYTEDSSGLIQGSISQSSAYQDNLQSYMDVDFAPSSSFEILMKVATYESSLSDELETGFIEESASSSSPIQIKGSSFSTCRAQAFTCNPDMEIILFW